MIIFKRNCMNLIGGGMIGDSNCIGTSLNGLILNQPQKELNPFILLQKRFNSFRVRFKIDPFKFVPMQLESPIIPPLISFI